MPLHISYFKFVFTIVTRCTMSIKCEWSRYGHVLFCRTDWHTGHTHIIVPVTTDCQTVECHMCGSSLTLKFIWAISEPYSVGHTAAFVAQYIKHPLTVFANLRNNMDWHVNKLLNHFPGKVWHNFSKICCLSMSSLAFLNTLS